MTLDLDSNSILFICTVASAITTLFAFFITAFATFYTFRTFTLKEGTDIAGSYTKCLNSCCNDQYVSSLTLENMKDKSEIIYGIYLRFSHSIYLLLDDLEKDPLILKPFEAFTKEYAPLEHYNAGGRQLNMNNLFSNKPAPKLILSTANGKYVVKSRSKHWDPIIDCFKNNYTTLAYPKRSTYKEKYIGSNVKYIVDIEHNDGTNEIIELSADDDNSPKFNSFSLTKESLQSKTHLNNFLQAKIHAGVLKVSKLKVVDISAIRDGTKTMTHPHKTEAKQCSWFQYYINGKIHTAIRNFKSRREIRKKLQPSKTTTK